MAKATLEEINQELINFVSENIMDESASIAPETLFRDVGIDSFSIIQIVLFVERKYDLPITEKDLTPENLKSVASLADFTYNHL